MNNESQIQELEQLIDTATRLAAKRFVEETVKFVKEHRRYDSRKDCDIAHSKSINREVAEAIYNAGYRKQFEPNDEEENDEIWDSTICDNMWGNGL